MRICVALAVVALMAYIVCFASGCSLLPLEDMHAHEHEDEHKDEQKDEHEHEETAQLADQEYGPEFAMQPPHVQEQIRKTTVDQAIEMLKTPGPDAHADAGLVVGFVYHKAKGQDRKRLEAAALDLVENSDNPATRKTAISLLPRFEDTHRDIRINAAKSDPDISVRRAAVSTLAADGVAVQDTLTELTRDSDADIRKAAQDILTQLRAATGDEGIRQLVQDLGVYRNDASALASTALVVRGPQALPYLIDAVNRDPNDHRRAAATTCIAMICAGNNPSLDEFAKRAHATRHGEQIRIDANMAGLEPLLYVLENDPYPPAREAAAQGLGYLGSVKAVPALAKALKDPNDYVRRRAAAALETLPGTGAVAQLANAAVNDRAAAVRAYAVKALGNVGTPEVVSPLARATEDPAPEVRQSAAEELGRIRAQEALDALVKLFGDPDDDVRWAAVRAVGDLQNKRAMPYLVKALQDDAPQVCNAAERGLQKLGVAKRKATGFAEPAEDSG